MTNKSFSIKLSTCLRVSILLISLFSIITFSYAQDKHDIVLKAMQDELKRSMTDLTFEGYEKPFFIQYGIQSGDTYSIIASLGSLYRSSENHGKGKSVRILVGDYDFNDESLDDDITSSPEANDIDLPQEDDYFGIRRAFWATTDNVYRNAAKHFARNAATLKDQKKPLEEIPHRRFAKVPPTQLIEEGKPFDFDKAKWENYCREVSALFKDVKAIQYSGAIIAFQKGHNYMVNSEGSIIKTPFSNATISVTAQGRTPDGETLMEQVTHTAATPDKLPSLENLKKEITGLIERIENINNIPKWKDDYAGPVLFIGEPAAEALAGNIFYGKESLEDNNSIPSLKGYRLDVSNQMDAKIGKTLFAESMTVRVMPKLKTFQGVDLLGSYDVDDEGVVPPAEMVLVEKGVLKNVLNDRTLTKEGQVPTGHGSGPGVVTIDYKNETTLEKLKQKLMEHAKADGQNYAVIVRDKSIGRSGMTYVYKVSLEDGKEELYRAAKLEPVTQKVMKKVVGSTTEKTVNNIQAAGRLGMLSMITPTAILLEEVEVSDAQIPLFKDEDYVESPLGRGSN